MLQSGQIMQSAQFPNKVGHKYLAVPTKSPQLLHPLNSGTGWDIYCIRS